MRSWAQAAPRLPGAIIGLERQWRQQMAGLRTNALAALGTALFELFAAWADALGRERRERP